MVDGKETQWRYSEGNDPYVKAGAGYQFYGKPDGKAVILHCHLSLLLNRQIKNMTYGYQQAVY
ncbi:hypothetical protein J4731_20865 [Providencia rettgeri]|nr:hypothetical protein [Providencia rettgeri]